MLYYREPTTITTKNCVISLVEFHRHVVLAYAENSIVIYRYLWPSESKSAWPKCVHVERSEISVKKCIFGSKNKFLTCFKREFSIFWLKCKVFTLRKVCKRIYFSFWYVTSELIIIDIKHFGQKAVFFDFW